MALPGEMEAGSAGKQPYRGIAWRLIETMIAGAEVTFRARPKTLSDRKTLMP